MVTARPHPHALRGLSVAGPRRGPFVLQRTDQEVVGAVLGELETEAGRAKLVQTEAKERGSDGRLRLYQPVHRTHHVALLEAFCQDEGEPRVDPARVESAGLVVRRVRRGTDGRDVVEGWMRAGGRVIGWQPLALRALDRDPDPDRRHAAAGAGNPEIERLLAAARGVDETEEAVSPLFVAPPEVCRSARRTVLFGLVPLASAETSETPPVPIRYPDADVRGFLAHWVREPGTHRWGGNQEYTHEGTAAQLRFLEAISFVDAPEVRAILDRVQVRYGTPAVVNGQTVWGGIGNLGAELAAVLDAFARAPELRRQTDAREWTLDGATAGALFEATRRLLEARMAGARPGKGRFDPGDHRYQVRAFVRLARPGCPPELVWSEPGDPFAIVPWFEAGTLPPVRVQLPEVSPAALRKLKPSVSFVTPASVADRLGALKLKDLIDGKAPGGGSSGSGGVDWICGFNIPIITLCAYIVLSLFLALLNIVFWWLPFVKICIPIPRGIRREDV